MTDYVLELERIEKGFGGVAVLRGVDFKLRRGSIHALVGGNGAGKSTLMKILTGVYTKDKGKCLINGKEAVINNYNEARQNGISLIFQELSLIPTLSVAENIFLNKEIKRGKFIDYKEMNRRSSELLSELGIEIDVKEKVMNLSVGYCQLIEIVKALSDDTSVLVMDEPTASLTEKETEALFKIIYGLKKKGISIIYISHRMKEIFQIADDISVLYGGQMVVSKPTAEYTLESLIEYMMGGKKNEQAMEWKERTTPIGSKNLLEIRDLSVGDRVKNVSFNIREGEVVGLAGLMGSGRTEVLEAIFGIRKSQGSIILEGKERQFKNVRQAIENKVALVPENRRREGLVLPHELRENLILTNLKSVKRRGFLSGRAADELGQKAISQFNIKTDSVRTRLFNLSGGNQQKVVIAKWMNIGPRLLMLDEPTAGVDIGAKGEIIDIIRKYAAQGHGVLMVSSELSELMAVCDRVVVLRDGVKSGELTHEEMDTEEVLQRAIQK